MHISSFLNKELFLHDITIIDVIFYENNKLTLAQGKNAIHFIKRLSLE